MTQKIAAQLYTLRDFTKTELDFATTLARLAKIGYRAVQISAVAAMAGEAPLVSPTLARKMLDDNGITCIATHRSWDELARNTQKEIDFHKTIGCDFVAIGSLPSIYLEQKADGLRQWLKDAQPVIEKLEAAGLQFGYHNHTAEFERTGPDRKPLFDILIEQTNPELLIELDVAWVEHVGFNPIRIIERLHGRIPVIHLRDKEFTGGRVMMAPVGEGNFDWATLLPALKAAGVKWYAIELEDISGDMFDGMRSSFDFLSRFDL